MGRKKRRWAKWRARQQSPGIGKLIAWAEWEEGGETDANKKESPPQRGLNKNYTYSIPQNFLPRRIGKFT